MTEKIELQTVNEIIPENINFETILNINTKSVNELTHGFHKYPGKFIPQIPNWAINKYLKKTKKATVLDPFCGSGTTLVESNVLGYNAIGIDIDPLSVLISQVKTTKINIDKLNEIIDWLKKNLLDTKINSVFLPKINTLNHWFNTDAIHKLGKIRFIINEIPKVFPDNQDIHNLIITCFSSIIRRVSNADNQSQKTYVSHTLNKNPEEVYSLFFSQLNYYKQSINDFNVIVDSAKSKVLNNSSSESLNNLILNQDIDLAITSPPYIKAIDYVYNQMAELFWIGDLFGIETQEKQNSFKQNYIGNKQINKAEYSKFTPQKFKTEIEILDINLKTIIETDKKNGLKHAYVTWKYFAEMDKHFKEMSNILKKDASYIMVVGDSAVSGVNIYTATILCKIAEKYSFKLANKWGYKIKNRYMRFDRKGRGGIINIDWVLEFKKVSE